MVADMEGGAVGLDVREGLGEVVVVHVVGLTEIATKRSMGIIIGRIEQ